MKVTSKQAGIKDSASIKTFAIKLPTAMHEQLAIKAQQHDIGMQDLGMQLCDLFLRDKIELSVKIPVPKDIAAELAAALADPAKAAELLKTLRSASKRAS